MRKERILIVFGTRPEAIKMAPLIAALKDEPDHFDVAVCITAQHREMLDQVLSFFNIEVDYDLDLMKPNQSLHSLTAKVISGLEAILEEYRPNLVFVHGDTTTTLGTSLAAFYSGSRVCHIEAGLRTFNKLAPFPEEMNRVLTSHICDIHFAPTENSALNLKREGINGDILVTGNTVIDALNISVGKVTSNDYKDPVIQILNEKLTSERVILVTGHRRENHGVGLDNICEALYDLALNNQDIQIIYPVHLNPRVQRPVYNKLKDIDNILLFDPLSYPCFVWLMARSYLIITDSGGVQEEAPSLGKPVLVTREITERPEAVEAGTVKLVGTNKKRIIDETCRLLEDPHYYNEMSKKHNPYGDGKSCERMVRFLLNSMNKRQ